MSQLLIIILNDEPNHCSFSCFTSYNNAMTISQFVHLRTHSEYSISQGMVRIPELCDSAAKDGMPSVALTDLDAYANQQDSVSLIDVSPKYRGIFKA